jgi:flagella basal body P-ring formation protein FlgA
MKFLLSALMYLAMLLPRGGGSVLLALTNEPSALSSSTNPAVDTAPRTRALTEADTRALLVAALQTQYVAERGELDLRFTRPWPTITVPDEPLTLNVIDVPTLGVTPSFIVRFEIRTASASLGTWQMPVQAKVFRDVWVARSALTRGQLLATADCARERRDVLALREACWNGTAEDAAQFELGTNVPAGAPLYAGTVKPRTLVRRGQWAEAMAQDGALLVSLKVEVLEDGAHGQTVRVRNPRSKTEFRGKVQNEQTVLVVF